MYNTVDSLPRADISTVLMDAVGQEKHFIGQLVMPIFGSGNEVGRYPRFKVKESELLRAGKGYAGSTKRNETGSYNEIDRKFTWDSFQTEEYGLEERVDDVVARRMESFFDAEMVTSKLLMNALMLDYEQEVAAAIMDPNTFTATNPTVDYTEANILTIDFPRDVNELIERMTLLGETPNTIILSLSVFNRLRRSKLLQLYVYGFLNVSQGGSSITPEMIGQVFGLNVLIAKKSVDVAVKGLDPSLTPVWGNDYIAVLNVQGGDFLNGGVGRTIVWDADSPGGLFTSESYRDERRRGTMIRIRSNRVLKIMQSNGGQLIRTNWA